MKLKRIPMIKNTLVVALLALPLVAPAPARASEIITGVLNTTGTALISLGTIGFLENSFTINSPGGAQQGGFTALAGTTGTISDITNPPDGTGPVNKPLFMTFAFSPHISFYLTFLAPGINGAAGCATTPAAAGQICTPNLPNQSPYNLQNTSATSSTASFSVSGVEVDDTTGEIAPFVGIFSTQFANLNYQQVLAAVLAGGTVTTSFSAQFAVTAVPEPSTMIELFAGLGAIGLGLIPRRKSRYNA